MKFKMRNDIRQKFRINGYWLPYGKLKKETFKNYVCCVNDKSENLEDRADDQEIFYDFADWKEVDSFRKVKGRIDSEFVITKILDY